MSYSAVPLDILSQEPLHHLGVGRPGRRLGMRRGRDYPFTYGTASEFQAPEHALDVVQTDDSLIVKLDVPGFKQKDLDLQLDNDCLTISGDIGAREMGLLRRADLLFSEREHEHFERKVPLPRSALGVQTDEIKVDLCCGVLKATIPLKPRETEVVHVPIA